MSATTTSSQTQSAAVTRNLFGPELPFLFETSGPNADFSWSELVATGDTGIGTVNGGAGEVLGVDGEFYVATADEPTPQMVSDEQTPTGAVAIFEPQESGTVAVATDLDAFQDALDEEFGTTDTETSVWIFTATGTLSSLEYQLEWPTPNDEVTDEISEGKSL
ncbi:MAG: acetolactate decarboxylase [Ornithinimicrobium sp.]